MDKNGPVWNIVREGGLPVRGQTEDGEGSETV